MQTPCAVIGSLVLLAHPLVPRACAQASLPASQPASRQAATRPAAGPVRVLPRLERAHPFVAQSLSGELVDFPGAYKGKLVLLVFWAPWCGYSQKEFSYWREAYAAFHRQGLEIVGVILDRDHGTTGAQAAEFVRDKELVWENIFDGAKDIGELYSVDALPVIYLVDGDTGRVVADGVRLRRILLPKTIEAQLAAKRGKSASQPASQPAPGASVSQPGDSKP